MMSLAADLELLLRAAQDAGDAASAYFRMGQQTSAVVTFKPGDSPVSEADIAANTALEARLRLARPAYGWVSEETLDDSKRLLSERIFVVDPIDGTRAFIAGLPQWCVSVALVERGIPVCGVIHAPQLGHTYMAMTGHGATRNGMPIRGSARGILAGACVAGPKPSLQALASSSGVDLVFAPKMPSLAYRLAQAADGGFDIALASQGSHDWDIAAADIILREAGAVLLDHDGKALVYNRSDLRRGRLVAGPEKLAKEAIRLLGLHS